MVKLAVVTCASLLLETMSRPRPLPSSRLGDLDLGTMWERMVLPSEMDELLHGEVKVLPEADRRAMMYADVSSELDVGRLDKVLLF